MRKLSLRVPRDGYTFKGKIEGKDGLWPDVKFDYRPALFAAHQDYLAQPNRTGEEIAVAMSEFLVKHIVKWDATDADGSSLPLTAATLRECHIPVLTMLMNYVTSYTAPQQEADAKNSG